MYPKISDVLPHSLGIRKKGGKMDILLKRNALLKNCWMY